MDKKFIIQLLLLSLLEEFRLWSVLTYASCPSDTITSVQFVTVLLFKVKMYSQENSGKIRVTREQTYQILKHTIKS